MPRLRAFWDAARRKPGLTTTAGALVVLVGGWLVGLPMLLAFLGAFALVVVGASVVNGRYVRRRLLILCSILAGVALSFLVPARGQTLAKIRSQSSITPATSAHTCAARASFLLFPMLQPPPGLR